MFIKFWGDVMIGKRRHHINAAYKMCADRLKNNVLLNSYPVHDFLRATIQRNADDDTKDPAILQSGALQELGSALSVLGASLISDAIFAHQTDDDETLPTEGGEGLGPGAMADRIREFDWSKTALGPVGEWHPNLSLAVQSILDEDHPMAVCWGDELVCIYNDAALEILGPEWLGRRGSEPWADGWFEIGSQFAHVMEHDSPVWEEGRFIPLRRNGGFTGAWWTYSIAPIGTQTGVGGVLMAFNRTDQPSVIPEERTAIE